MSYKIYNDDCMEVLKSYADKSIDLVVTDPPYPVISGGKPHKKGQPSGMLSKNDGKIFDYNNIDPKLWMPEIYRVLKNGSQCYIMVNTINLKSYLAISESCGFKLHNVLVWEKNNVTPSRWYMKNGEFTLFLRKGKAKTINNVGSKMVHQFNNIIGNKAHPTEKPIELMRFYVENSSSAEDLVLDPFMGCGSTGVACLNCGRNFIGIEIDKKYYDVAEERLKRITYEDTVHRL